MKIGGIDLGNAFVGAGTLNFFGQGWPHHKWYKFFPGFNFKGSTMITKTTTLEERNESGLILNLETLQPLEKFSDCIKVSFSRGEIFNSVGLSGPGAKFLFESEIWQEISEPLIISFAPTGANSKEILEKTALFANIFEEYIYDFVSSGLGLEMNFSCPNLKDYDLRKTEELLRCLERTFYLGIPQGIKINVSTPIEVVKDISDSGYCDFIDIPNSLPLAKNLKIFNQKRVRQFLEKNSSGGFSGEMNWELAKNCVRSFREKGIENKIILGGVFSRKNVREAKEIGADAISFARVSIVRPWRIKGIIKEANRIFEN